MLQIVLAVLAVTGIPVEDTWSVHIPVMDPWLQSVPDVAELGDGSTAVSTGVVMEDIYVLHYDHRGEFIFEQDGFQAGERSLESGGWIVPVPGGGYYFIAYSEPRATGVDSDIALFRLAADYEILWSRVIGRGTDDVYTGFGASGFGDCGVAVLGGEGYAGLNAFIRVYDDKGDLQWEHSYPEDDGYLPVSVGKVEGGSLVLLGHQWEEAAYLQKFSLNGVLEWELEIPAAALPGAPVSFSETDSGYAVFYCTRDGVRQEGAIISIDRDGDPADPVVFFHGMMVSDALFQDGQRILIAGQRALDGRYCAVLEAYDLQGSLMWKRRLESGGESAFTALSPSCYGGCVLSGYIISEDQTSGGVLVRTTEEGIVQGGTSPALIPAPSI